MQFCSLLKLQERDNGIQQDGITCHMAKILVNPLPLLFKALLHGQKDRVFSAGI